MKRQMMMAGLASALLLSACGNGDEATDAAENEDPAAAEETSDSGQADITAEQQQSLDEKFNGMANDELIDAIEPQSPDYSEITITVSDEASSMNGDALRGKMQGIGESVRSGTAGILHDGADDKLPLVEFENPDSDVIAHYDSHERDAELIME
ncbi:hypothetical protein [Salinicoccus roseus]|uniref:Uncharacterized protein n=1 Tax=Salinicoccus roseus TaxID=45670 RepID=A0A0C2E7Y3_9STAP|nr:hypothetical protein [Salinicoccus roseus]KIH71392.1 hypothetical protein SN16_01505 [Salinicoccus roseus]MDB0579447.1 hypothetical protein [Salinicoccus roseus]